MGKSKTSPLSKTASVIGAGGAGKIQLTASQKDYVLATGGSPDEVIANAEKLMSQKTKKPEEKSSADYHELSSAEFDAMEKEHTAYLKTIDKEYLKHISDYTGDEYQIMNIVSDKGADGALAFFKENGIHTDTALHTLKAYEKKVKSVEKTLKNAPELKQDTVLFRGINHGDPWYNLKEGDTGVFANSKSSSPKKGAIVISKPMMVEMRLKKGTHAGAYIAPISHYNNEMEFLLRKGLKYKVVSKVGSKMVMEVE